MKEDATWSGGATPRITCNTNVNKAIAGKGMGSNVTSIKTNSNIIKLWYAGTERPIGVLKFNRNIEIKIL
jgi:hypothetical protein|tara:strand:- start:19048 stop:19257 length:210 start_codon:yes stop_codon:yes gene_type:complete